MADGQLKDRDVRHTAVGRHHRPRVPTVVALEDADVGSHVNHIRVKSIYDERVERDVDVGAEIGPAGRAGGRVGCLKKMPRRARRAFIKARERHVQSARVARVKCQIRDVAIGYAAADVTAPAGASVRRDKDFPRRGPDGIGAARRIRGSERERRDPVPGREGGIRVQIGTVGGPCR